METRANYAIIGIFTLAVIAAGFLFVFWFSGTDSRTKRQPIRVVFTGSVAGLTKGSAVLFNGIRVGDVARVYFEKDKPQQAFADVEVDLDTPIRMDTKARLDVTLLSGAALVAFNGGGKDSPPLTATAGNAIPTITAEPSDLSSLLEQARGTAQKADQLLVQVNGIVSENRETISGTLKNLQSFSEALARNAPSIDRALASVGAAAEKIGPLAVKLETLTDDVGGVVRAVDPKQVSAIIGDAAGLMKTFNDNRPQINSILLDVATLSRRLNDTVPKLDQTLTGASNVLAAIDPAKVAQVVDNTNRFTTAVANSSNDVEAALKNASAMTAKLNRSADRVDGVLAAAEAFLGSAAGQEGKSTFASIRGAADSVRKTADNLDKRFMEISVAISRFSGTGSKQVEAVAVDARRTVNDVGRAARDLDRNPSSIIFGGNKPPLPTYTGP
jgi:phospholipid/cholesterol/gamma-HCH transport system substrate-binding protein